jgi:hypothetical protein
VLMAVMNLLIMTVPLFYGNCGAAFNQDLSSWDTSKATVLISSGKYSQRKVHIQRQIFSGDLFRT